MLPLEPRRIDVRIVDHPLRPERVIRTHAATHDRSRFLIVRVTDAAGRVGHGEAATTAMWSGESADSAEAMICTDFAPVLVGRTFAHPREALAVLDATAFGNPFAKSAVDTALWDLWARANGVNVAALAGDRPAVARIPTRASVGAYDTPRTLELAQAFWDAGIRTLKFKTGMAGVDDARRMAAVRDRLGDGPVFTIDANGAYATAGDAVAAIERLQPFGLALVEQPTPRDRLSMLAEVRRNVAVPIMVDEGVFTRDQLEEALDLDAFDILSIYPGKNGGFTHALDLAARARAAGKACAIGSNLETDLGQAAMACLAASNSAFPVDRIACDLPAVVFYRVSSLVEPLRFVDGCIEVPTGLGFGVEPLAAGSAMLAGARS
ncbi:MAG: chloromuconate cycloisomerase [Planctomycetes bacterium]|nr:chloromuconate cycloisomerase [Planctomycetota bacterium]